jgi:hypothetical protein
MELVQLASAFGVKQEQEDDGRTESVGWAAKLPRCDFD